MTPTKSTDTRAVHDRLEGSARKLSPPLLNAYFHGQLLSAEGLERAELQARYTSALLAGLLTPSDFGFGGAVLIGLEVAKGPLTNPPGDPLTVTVSSGVAIDGYGRLVVVPDHTAPDGTGKPSGTASISLANSLSADIQSPATFDLVIHHALFPIELSPVLAGSCDGGVPEYAKSLYREGYRLEFTAPSSPAEVATHVDDVFPIEPAENFASNARPGKLIEYYHRKSPSASPGAGNHGTPISSSTGIVLARITATFASNVWTLADPTPSPGRREVFPLATLTQIVLDLAARVDSTSRRRTLSIAGGNAQTAQPGKALANPLQVKVLDASGNPSKGVSVTFVPTGGGGAVSPPSATSDPQGLAAVSWTLGAGEGLNTVEAAITPQPEDFIIAGPVSFVALAQSPPPPPVKPVPLPIPPCKPEPEPVPEPAPPPVIQYPPEPAPVVCEPPGAPGPPALTSCAPLGGLDRSQAETWLGNPVLALAFDRAMDPEDLARPHEWLQVFHMKRVPFDRPQYSADEIEIDDIALFETTRLPLSPIASSSPEMARYACGLDHVASCRTNPDEGHVFLVLIDPSHGYPRAAGSGKALGIGLAGTTLTSEEFRRIWSLEHSGRVPIDWRHLVPCSEPFDSTQGGLGSGYSQVVFYLGHPHGFDAPQEYTP